MTERQMIERLIMAWESLPGVQRHSRADVERWLSEQLKPAFDEARKEMGLPIPSGLR